MEKFDAAVYISDDMVQAYNEDGVIKVTGAFSQEWIDRLREGVQVAMDRPGPFAEEYDKGNSRFFGDLDVWTRHKIFKEFIFESPAAALMARVMRSSKINFFYDQLLVKEPGTQAKTPWHQDQPYWAVSGKQVASIWLPMDSVSNDVAVKYVRGSHLWQEFNPYHFSDNSPYQGTGLPPMPDIDEKPEKYEILGWDLEPGDCLIFQAMITHGSAGNSSLTNRRRAYATRWTGDDARFCMRKGEVAIPTTDPGLQHGDEMTCEMFPHVWP